MILVTGANGFVGQAMQALPRSDMLWCVRREDAQAPEPRVISGDINAQTDWYPHLPGVDGIVHLAARVHVMDEQADDPLQAFRAVNTDGTLNLARQAAEAGVKRFIYLSSIKVNGEETPVGQPFTQADTPKPHDPYAQSKHEAEVGLRALAQETGMDVVILRPPLIYGPGVKANFARLIGMVNTGIPLPFGAVRNARSLVAVANLVDCIARCIDHPTPLNDTFLVTDDDDLSTSALMRGIARALGKPARLLPLTQPVLIGLLALAGKREIARRLCGNLQMDIRHTKDTLDWQPPVAVQSALDETVAAYRQI